VKELFESSLSFIIVAIIVGIRLVLFLRKRAVNKQEQSRNTPPPLAGITEIEAEMVAIPEEDDDDEDFSAWALSVEAQEPAPPSAVPSVPAGGIDLSPAILSSSIPEAAPISIPVPEVWSPPYPASALERESEIAQEPAQENMPFGEIPEIGDDSGNIRPVKTGGAFWRKLRTLPSLRQGIILSEILGPPKGF
jgi:hypothetical protein